MRGVRLGAQAIARADRLIGTPYTRYESTSAHNARNMASSHGAACEGAIDSPRTHRRHGLYATRPRLAM